MAVVIVTVLFVNVKVVRVFVTAVTVIVLTNMGQLGLEHQDILVLTLEKASR